MSNPDFASIVDIAEYAHCLTTKGKINCKTLPDDISITYNGVRVTPTPGRARTREEAVAYKAWCREATTFNSTLSWCHTLKILVNPRNENRNTPADKETRKSSAKKSKVFVKHGPPSKEELPIRCSLFVSDQAGWQSGTIIEECDECGNPDDSEDEAEGVCGGHFKIKFDDGDQGVLEFPDDTCLLHGDDVCIQAMGKGRRLHSRVAVESDTNSFQIGQLLGISRDGSSVNVHLGGLVGYETKWVDADKVYALITPAEGDVDTVDNPAGVDVAVLPRRCYWSAQPQQGAPGSPEKRDVQQGDWVHVELDGHLHWAEVIDIEGDGNIEVQYDEDGLYESGIELSSVKRIATRRQEEEDAAQEGDEPLPQGDALDKEEIKKGTCHPATATLPAHQVAPQSMPQILTSLDILSIAAAQTCRQTATGKEGADEGKASGEGAEDPADQEAALQYEAAVDGTMVQVIDKDMLKVAPISVVPRRAVKPWLKYGERSWSGTKTTYLKCRYKSCGARKKVNRRDVDDGSGTGATKAEMTEEPVGEHSNHDVVEVPDPADLDPEAIAQKRALKLARKEGEAPKSNSRRAKKAWLKYGERSLANVTTTYFKCRFKGCPARQKVTTKVVKDDHGMEISRTIDPENIGIHDGHPPEGPQEVLMSLPGGKEEEDGKDVSAQVAAALKGSMNAVVNPMHGLLPQLLMEGHPDPNTQAIYAGIDTTSQQALEAAQAQHNAQQAAAAAAAAVAQHQQVPQMAMLNPMHHPLLNPDGTPMDHNQMVNHVVQMPLPPQQVTMSQQDLSLSQQVPMAHDMSMVQQAPQGGGHGEQQPQQQQQQQEQEQYETPQWPQPGPVYEPQPGPSAPPHPPPPHQQLQPSYQAPPHQQQEQAMQQMQPPPGEFQQQPDMELLQQQYQQPLQQQQYQQETQQQQQQQQYEQQQYQEQQQQQYQQAVQQQQQSQQQQQQQQQEMQEQVPMAQEVPFAQMPMPTGVDVTTMPGPDQTHSHVPPVPQ